MVIWFPPHPYPRWKVWWLVMRSSRRAFVVWTLAAADRPFDNISFTRGLGFHLAKCIVGCFCAIWRSINKSGFEKTIWTRLILGNQQQSSCAAGVTPTLHALTVSALCTRHHPCIIIKSQPLTQWSEVNYIHKMQCTAGMHLLISSRRW